MMTPYALYGLLQAEKAGYTREGTLRASGFNARQGRRVDYAVFSLLPGEAT